jgi:L-fuconolactonase
VIEAFGPRRSFWGSDITRVPPTCSLRQVVTQFTEELDFLSPTDLEWIMGRGLAECLGWPVG